MAKYVLFVMLHDMHVAFNMVRGCQTHRVFFCSDGTGERREGLRHSGGPIWSPPRSRHLLVVFGSWELLVLREAGQLGQL